MFAVWIKKSKLVIFVMQRQAFLIINIKQKKLIIRKFKSHFHFEYSEYISKFIIFNIVLVYFGNE
jgi:hypothetical protein